MPCPIVFFPGVMGSRLYFPNSNLYWDPDSTWQMTWWMPVLWRSDDDNRRDLHIREPAGVLIDPHDGDDFGDAETALGWGGVVWSYYKDYLWALRDLAADGQAHAVGYDWRQDIRWLGEYAAEKLWKCLADTGADRLWVATHSMGGLVARAALRHDGELAKRVEKVVHVCQPTVGAVVLYRRLLTGLKKELDEGLAFRILLGNSRAGFVGNMSGQPGPLQLLPSRFFLTQPAWHGHLDTGTVFDDLYTGLIDAALGLDDEVVSDLRARVDDVSGFHAWLGDPRPAADGPETWLVYGTGVKTEIAIGFDGLTASPRLSLHGDGTVPVVSACALGLPEERMLAVADMVHADACNHKTVRAHTARIFQ
jgi:hypothetical protein